MASESKTVAVIPLNGSNYPTWKVQCRMALMKDGLWTIVDGSEACPAETEVKKRRKFVARRDRALALIVLSVEPSLLYLIGDPEDPTVVWKKLADQFQKKTWANKLALRRKLYSLQLKEGGSVQEHIRTMTEIFDGLSVAGSPVDEEDRVVHLLASLPESYSMLVTALEASPEVPKMEVVTERLLHEERKLQEPSGTDTSRENALMVDRRSRRKGPRCHYCHKFGHIRRDCYEFAQAERSSQTEKTVKHKASKADARQRRYSSDSESEGVGLVVKHALSATAAGERNSWVVDSGATCHMCNDEKLFTDLRPLKHPQDVALGDGHTLEATGCGVVALTLNLPGGKTKSCKLHDVLYVRKLSYNLLSVSKVADAGKGARFDKGVCQIVDAHGDVIATATKVGSLYYLDCHAGRQIASVAGKQDQRVKESVWHQRYGHLGVKSLQQLAREKLVDGFDYNPSTEVGFCEPCAFGKHHRSPFPAGGGDRCNEPLGLVHSDVCGKMSTPSLSGGEYFLTFVDDKTRYVWMYVLKRKDQVFQRFLEWKAQVEKSTGRNVKVLRTDNGGEYTSVEFDGYLKSEGVRHEFSMPKTPEQNGVAERMNRTLVEMVRSMLADAKLPRRFWAEALSTAVYLRNRSPTHAVKGMTPFEAWMGSRPNVDHLRAFGCAAYAHIAKDERRKLDPKARRCIMLGYGSETKGYRLYDPQRERVFHSRDVRFNECERGIEKVSAFPDVILDMGETGFEKKTSEQERYVQLDSLSDRESVGAEEQVADQSVEPALRRSGRERRPPDYYEKAMVAHGRFKEPATVEEALESPDKAKWLDAMNAEVESLHANEVWDLVELPKDRRAVGSKWVFKRKVDAEGTLDRHKARLVAQGFSQKYGIDYDETFCPVVRFESFRTVVALAVQNRLKLHQMDVKTAFLNGELEEEVYMNQPEGFVVQGQEHLVCKLKRSIYGLKQSPRCWNSALDGQLRSMGFVQTASDPCLYTASEGEMFIIAVYVDDIVLAGLDERMTEVKRALAVRFDVKDMGELHHFLGMKVIQDQKEGSVWVGQPAYAESILEKFGMKDAKPVNTPFDPSVKLVKTTESDDSVDTGLYQSAVGSLLYLSVATRPDIAYAVSNVARFCANPSKQHWTAVKRIMRYLKGSVHFGLLYTKNGVADCVGYSDADWAGDLDDRKSTSGYMFQISGAAVSWRSKKQSCVVLSTAEAEYMALANAAQEAIWMRQLTSNLNNGPTRATTILEVNQAAICMAKNPQFHGRAKHIAIKFHFIREQVSSGAVELRYCPTDMMVADILTKGLYKDRFAKLRQMAGVNVMPGHSACK